MEALLGAYQRKHLDLMENIRLKCSILDIEDSDFAFGFRDRHQLTYRLYEFTFRWAAKLCLLGEFFDEGSGQDVRVQSVFDPRQGQISHLHIDERFLAGERCLSLINIISDDSAMWRRGRLDMFLHIARRAIHDIIELKLEELGLIEFLS